MVAQPLKEFMTPCFLDEVATNLSELGFVSDEHSFAAYRETLSTHYETIENALAVRGHEFRILPGFVEHTRAGYAYFVYDSIRFKNYADAAAAVVAWLDKRYS